LEAAPSEKVSHTIWFYTSK